MKEIIISKTEDGMRLNKYLHKVFDSMPESLLYKLLRKKYFELNDKKTEGNEILKAGDRLSIFLSDDTFEKFYKGSVSTQSKSSGIDCKSIVERIVYEDSNIIIFNKPVGMLSQGDKSNDESANSLLKDYTNCKVNETGNVDIFKPSIVNRLDRNTEGLLIFAKTYIAAAAISKQIQSNEILKKYKAIVNGVMQKDRQELVNLYRKDDKTNKAIIKELINENNIPDGYDIVKLIYNVVKQNKDNAVLDVELITGKSHQIRAQLSYIGHPIICDKKYMSAEKYRQNVEEYGYKSQRLICYKVKFGKFENENLKNLSNKIFEIDCKEYK